MSIPTAKAQLYEAGIHLGYNLSKIRVKDFKLSDEISVLEGRRVSGGSFGVQFMLSPPKEQNVMHFKIIPSVLVEGSLCRCGGEVGLITTFPDGSSSFSELRYRMYRSNVSLKFVGNMKKSMFIVGPTFSNNFYSGVTIGNSETKFAGDQFALFTVGYEIGLGQRLGRFIFSARMNGALTDFGKETDLFPTVYGYRDFRLMMHYSIYSNHRGLNYDSIYRKKKK